MFSTNVWATLILFVAMVVTNEGPEAIEFAERHSGVWWKIISFCLVSAVGQNFIFASISCFGSLSCSIITTTRKFFTILFSVIWFNHPLTFWQIFGVALVFTGLGWDIYVKYTTPDQTKGIKKNTEENVNEEKNNSVQKKLD
eukprot:TRINITY_DN1494_c0_g1_i3.p1 TRINITY_DN1494_c0_g1~~TRINITY_DN1494_c0_g1_i3.p1  ORF type:complete len:142 (-),score=14.94 TRINITY_DN1494_c0_g1_i3:24-449(-)